MPYELLNTSQVTPPRLHAMLRLITRPTSPTRKDLLDLLQPVSLVLDQSAAKNIFNAAINCNLIEEREGKVVLNGDPKSLESLQGFQALMQQIVLGVKEAFQPNYLFNLYSAWYVVQNERVFQFEDKDYEIRFNEEMFQDAESRTFNMTKFNGWRMWAAFLGLGWPFKNGQREILVPDATKRLHAVLPQLLSKDGKFINFGVFAERLTRVCPEMDGGLLFSVCWQASRTSEQRGNRLSLALSTGLRQLHEAHEIELMRQADATDIWHLYPARGQIIKEVTHICLREA